MIDSFFYGSCRADYNMCKLGKFNIEKYQHVIVFCIFAKYCPLKYLGVFLWTT